MASLVTQAKIKEIVGDMKISEDYYPEINLEVERLIKKSVQRAKSNGRKTVMARDI